MIIRSFAGGSGSCAARDSDLDRGIFHDRIFPIYVEQIHFEAIGFGRDNLGVVASRHSYVASVWARLIFAVGACDAADKKQRKNHDGVQSVVLHIDFNFPFKILDLSIRVSCIVLADVRQMGDRKCMRKSIVPSFLSLVFSVAFSVLFLSASARAEAYLESDVTLYAAAQPLAAPVGYPLVNGEVRKVDLSSQKITIRHEEIPNLDMPPMTMVFKVNSFEILESVTAGAKIRFVADSINGQMTVLWLEVL